MSLNTDTTMNVVPAYYGGGGGIGGGGFKFADCRAGSPKEL